MKPRGFSLIETVVYVALFGLITIGVLRLVLGVSFNAAEIRSERRIASAGELGLETLGREIRAASEVTLASSVFGSSPGTLTLKTVTSPSDATEVIRTFSLSSSRLTRQDASGPEEFLTPADVNITNLTFWHSATSTSEMVSFQVTIEAGQGRAFESKTFYGSAVLRERYQ